MSTIITPAPAHQKPSGKLYLSADQLNLTTATWILIALDAISIGFTDGIEDTANHRITPGVAGFYDVTGMMRFLSVVADRPYVAGIRLNGVTYKCVTYSQAPTTSSFSVSCNLHLYLSATDYLELLAYHSAGVNTVDLSGLESTTFLSIQRVR